MPRPGTRVQPDETQARRAAPSRHAGYRFVGAPDLHAVPHVMVDGAPRDGTVCALSHWPGTPTPRALWADLSAEIVLKALEHPGFIPDEVEVASVDHEDVDGVVSVALLCVEGLAASHGPLLVEAARVGDFGVVLDRTAALVAFAVAAVLDRAGRGRANEQALNSLPALVADHGAYESLWRDEAASFDASGDAIAREWASIEERPELDLAVVRVDTRHPDAPSAAWGGDPLHRAAVHSATSCLRVATITPGRFEVRFRYESWVRLATRRPRPRVDLSYAARQLCEAETGGARWTFDGAGAITPALRVVGGGPSSLSPAHFLDVVCGQLSELDRGEPAWDPYA